jgi:cell division septum initiation protein DivIVA
MSSTEDDVLSKKGHETFEPAFESDKVPRIQLPNVPEDAQGLSARELAQVPTLDEQEATHTPVLAKAAAAQAEAPSTDTESPNASVLDELDALPVLDEVHAQEMPVHVDTWIEVLQKRTEKLTEEIRQLHERLDVLEEQSKG